VFHYAFPLIWHYAASIVCENAPLACYRPGRLAASLRDWPDEELEKIRIVLRKLTALRIDNHHDAEDLVQETMATMTAKCNGIEFEKGLLIWGMAILRRKIGNYYRRTRRYAPLDELKSTAGWAQAGIARPAEQESQLLYAELCSLLNETLANFPPRERMALELHLAGCPAREIADLLYPERYQNVVNWVHRGRRKLARELAKHGYGSSRGRI